MNLTIVLATLRQRFTSPIRLVLLLVIGWMPMMAILLAPTTGFAVLGDCHFLALALAAGMIGQDVASGTLQLVLSRPVTRTGYVLSKWLAVTGGTLALVALQVGVATLIILVRGAHVPWDEAVLYLANSALLAAGAAAVMALLSALVPGLGDLGLLLLAFLSAQVLGAVGAHQQWSVMVSAADELQRTLKPELNLAPLFHGQPVSWLAVVAYLSTVTLCLAAAAVVMNRREFSYASTGA